MDTRITFDRLGRSDDVYTHFGTSCFDTFARPGLCVRASKCLLVTLQAPDAEVVRLDVPVQYVLRVHVLHPVDHLVRHHDRLSGAGRQLPDQVASGV